MGSNGDNAIPLGLPDQQEGLPTLPTDRGDETQERFRYQWAMGVCILAECLSGTRSATALWCEHHEDFLLQLTNGRYTAIQVKTDGRENAVWRLSDVALIDSIARFCRLQETHGKDLEAYEFLSNAAPYIPAGTARKSESLASSPSRVLHCCREVTRHDQLAEPYKSAFMKLANATGASADCLFAVLRKLAFRQGPPLRGYDDTLAVQTVPSIPKCERLLQAMCCRVRDELINLVSGACRLSISGDDGVIAYLANNGRPKPAVRSKCLTIPLVQSLVSGFHQPHFSFVNSGDSLKLGVAGKSEVLQRKMRNAYLGGQYEALRLRMDSAEQRLLERAYVEAESFSAIADQLLSAVLVECKDAEAMSHGTRDEKAIGPQIYKEVLQRMTALAKDDPGRVCNEPKDTLMGIAGMLSSECRFAWGVPLEETGDGT